MTKLYIHSTDPGIAEKIKPEVYQKILERRRQTQELIGETLVNTETITLEIGCGHGHFLTEYGKRFPNEICVGIDVNRGRIYKARRKVERALLTNVHFIECESLEFLALLPDKIRIQKTWVLYPDPWPKKRHLKNRIIQAKFLEALAIKSLKQGGLYIRSDYKPYLEWSSELIAESPNWEPTDDYEWPEITTTVFQELTDNRHFSMVAQLKPSK